MNVLTSHLYVIDTPAPTVNVLELADSSVNFVRSVQRWKLLGGLLWSYRK